MYESEVQDIVMFERELLENALQNNIVSVTFNKVNGEQRVMECTLLEGVVPETKGNRKSNPDVLNVWDINKRDWRSFRIANVTDFKMVKS